MSNFTRKKSVGVVKVLTMLMGEGSKMFKVVLMRNPY